MERACKFYDAVLQTIGIYSEFELPGITRAYGKRLEFWIGLPENQSRPASAGNGCHVAFRANSKSAVIDFYETALVYGGEGSGAPGYRVEYSEHYFAAFVLDSDGNKIEAVYYSGMEAES